MNFKHLFTILSLLFTGSIFSQTPVMLDSTNSFITAKCDKITQTGFCYWKCDSLSKGQLFTEFKNYTGLGAFDTMIIYREWEDSITYLQRVRYQQYYKGIPMEGAYYTEHSLGNKVLITNGYIVENMDKSSAINYNEEAALIQALNFIDAETYAWEDSMEYFLKLDSFANDTTYFPKGKLLWAKKGDRLPKDSNYFLAWKFNIYYLSSVDSSIELRNVYVDAQTGLVVHSINPKRHGSFNHYMYGTQTIDTRWYGGLKSKYFLRANDDGKDIRTKDRKFNKGWSDTDLPSDNDDNWNNSHWSATASHWAAEESWAYWRDVWGHRGVNGNNKQLRVQANINFANNADFLYQGDKSWDEMLIGNFDFNFGATPELVGHEFAHGIVDFVSELEYSFESAALHESYADIFGLLTQRRTFPSTFDWLLYDDLSPVVSRDLVDPKNTIPNDPGNCLPSTYPTYYLEPGSWFITNSTNCDWGGAHHNLSVQNKCFSLLALGGTHRGITVSGIGIDDAAMIAKVALFNFVQSSTTYPENREAWVAAAIELFGSCSFQVEQTCKAWSACNIGSVCPCVINPLLESPCADERWRYWWMEPEGPIMSINEKYIDNSIKVFPNPTMNELNINFGELTYSDMLGIKNICIMNVLGSEVAKFELSLNSNNRISSFDISNFESGVYFVQIIIGNEVKRIKFVKI